MVTAWRSQKWGSGVGLRTVAFYRVCLLSPAMFWARCFSVSGSPGGQCVEGSVTNAPWLVSAQWRFVARHVLRVSWALSWVHLCLRPTWWGWLAWLAPTNHRVSMLSGGVEVRSGMAVRGVSRAMQFRAGRGAKHRRCASAHERGTSPLATGGRGERCDATRTSEAVPLQGVRGDRAIQNSSGAG